MPDTSIITGIDFVGVSTQDLERSVAFYRDVLGLECSVHRPERHFAEFETGTVTLNIADPVKMGIGDFAPNPASVALHVEDIEAARAELESRGVQFYGDTFDTSVCHMAFFADPDGNKYMLHHRYAPKEN